MKPLLERAYEIARSGSCLTQTDVRIQLGKEGYTSASAHQHLSGTTVRKELNALCRAARGRSERQHGPKPTSTDPGQPDHQ